MNVSKENTYGRCRIIKEWPDWEYSIHCDKRQIDRQGYAMNYPFTFKINNITETAQFSSTIYPSDYDTTLSFCTCDDFISRKLPCKHIYRLASELGIIEIIKRPTLDKEKLSEIKKSSDIDNEPDQLKRQKSAMNPKCVPAEINFENQTAIFKGSGKSPYTTTVTSCTCRDYFVRRLPCKHIYRLRYELNSEKNVK